MADLATADLSTGATAAIKSLLESTFGSLLPSTPDVNLTPDGTEIDATFELKGSDTYTVPLNTQLGGLGLNFTTMGAVGLTLGYDMHLGFALNKTSGFSFILDPGSDGNEFDFTASAGLTPGTTLNAQLFFLDSARPNETTTGPGTGLNASLGIALPNPNGDDRLSLTDLGPSLFSASYNAGATANSTCSWTPISTWTRASPRSAPT